VQLELFHAIGQGSLSLTYPGRRDNHPCLIRLLRLHLLLLPHGAALEEGALCFVDLGESGPTRVRGNVCLEEQKEKKIEYYVPSMHVPAHL
jgi:hypothetical protein